MKFKANKIDKLINANSELILQLTISSDKRLAEVSYQECKDLGELDIEIKKHREKRSLDQNAYMWKLIYEIASALETDKDSVYLTMLKRYGIYTTMTANKKAVDRIMQQWKTVEVVDEKQQEGHEIVKLLCYYGSSTYNTKEMSVLLDGVVSEAKELGIETLDDIEYKRMMEEYERKEK